PGDLDKRVGPQQGAIGAVDDIEEAIAVGLHDDLADLAIDCKVGLYQLVDPIIIVRVIWRELIVPDNLAGFGPEGEHRGAIEIVPLAELGIPRAAVARAPIDQVKVRIVGASQPGRPATMLPGIARPGVATRLTGSRNSVAAPELCTRFRIP